MANEENAKDIIKQILLEEFWGVSDTIIRKVSNKIVASLAEVDLITED